MEPYSSDDIKRKKRKNGYGLNKLLGAIPEVTSAAIVSAEGLPIASALPQGVDETRIAAMSAALLSLSKKAIIEMSKGDFDQLYIKGSEGYLLVMQAGPNAVLTVSTSKDVGLGLILLDCRRICEKIAKLI
jgi:predicted regulator of Ras-like GTPase activity (Roadblock/LC7/MglB family)